MDSTVTPIAAKERIYTLDVIRGFALLGIFIMNMPWFNTSFYVGRRPAPNSGREWWDKWTETATEVLFSGKFNSMFSMLFAIGFTIQLERLEARDPEHAKAIYLRRIFWLFVFGAIHMCVFWTGDVLHIYALHGSGVAGAAPRALQGALDAVRAVPALSRWPWASTATSPSPRPTASTSSRWPQAWEATNNAAYGHGSFLAAAREHARETAAPVHRAVHAAGHARASTARSW